MSISKEHELIGMKRAAEVVATVLRDMRQYVQPGMTTKELDNYAGDLLKSFGARSAPVLTYGFPGWTCISVNNEIAHGIPSATKRVQEGDLVNIDVSAEVEGFWADNGGSFVLGEDVHGHTDLINASKRILMKAIHSVRSGVKIAEVGGLIEKEAKRSGFKVIKNLTGHGIGRALHEEPGEIANYYDKFNKRRFKKNSVVAIETFISTHSTFARSLDDDWTLVGNKGGFVAQHEHTIVVTDNEPIVLTAMNGIFG